ncbi:tRNA(Ile)-lysidine synthetase [Streptococcus sp. DD10]|nr:tRNA(Ile)-lysidine synthetase [Streptococcus sp. DD10]
MIKEDFLTTCLEKGYFEQHQRVLVAVSGGLDSMFLLECLSQFQNKLEIEIAIAHINHKQRKESDDEENQIKKIAEKLGVACYTSSFSGNFSENNARDFRYQFFQTIMEKKHYTCLVTAHHADDQVETVLMRLIRGTRLRYFTGIKERQKFANGELIRPLLHFYKSSFPEVTHFEDQSNFGTDFLRNRIRNLYLPKLEHENPRLRQGILDFSKQIDILYQSITELTDNINITDLKVFHTFSPATQSVLLEQYCLNFPDLQLTKSQFSQVLHILQGNKYYHHHLKSGYELYKNDSLFEIRKISLQSDSQKRSVLLQYKQESCFKDYLFSFGTKIDGENVEVYHVSRETPILLRLRQPHDKIVHNGMTKKLRRFLLMRKFLKKKEKRLLLLNNQEIY